MGNQSAECKRRTDPELIVASSRLEANERQTGEQFGAAEKTTLNKKDVKINGVEERNKQKKTSLKICGAPN